MAYESLASNWVPFWAGRLTSHLKKKIQITRIQPTFWVPGIQILLLFWYVLAQADVVKE